MDRMQQRLAVYGTLLVLCAVLGSRLGALTAALSFVQVAAVIELTDRLAGPGARAARGGGRHS